MLVFNFFFFVFILKLKVSIQMVKKKKSRYLIYIIALKRMILLWCWPRRHSERKCHWFYMCLSGTPECLFYVWKGKLTNKPIKWKFFSPLSCKFTLATGPNTACISAQWDWGKKGLLRWTWMFMGMGKWWPTSCAVALSTLPTVCVPTERSGAGPDCV